MSAEHKPAVLASGREHAIRARDYYNPPQHLQPYCVANPEPLGSADMLTTEDVCSRNLALAVHEDTANENAARILATVREGGS